MSDSRYASLYAKREKIQNKRITGFFQTIRRVTLYITLAWYFIAPWLSWHGRQAIWFNIPGRKFYIFFLTFWPQDFILLSWAIITIILALFVVTNFAGRLWCGYTCPQTAWTRCFMWLEYLIEGNRRQRLKLDKNPWSWNTMLRRTGKHLSWLVIAFYTAVTFVGYFVPIKTLIPQLVSFQVAAWPLLFIGFFTVATYYNAGWMREQLCIYLCPYAKLQGVMFDDDTYTVAYDYKRGEPRGSRKRDTDKTAKGLGDCINCMQCVHVCPTGIDIRDGLQIACIGCACCVDVCNQVMDKVGYERGLIRYTTEHALEHKPTKIFRLRLLATSGILLVMVGLLSYHLLTRVPIRLDVLHQRAQLFRMMQNGDVQNNYKLKVINMTQQQQSYHLQVTGIQGIYYVGPKDITVKADSLSVIPISLQVPKNQVQHAINDIAFTLENKYHPKQKVTTVSRFIGPQLMESSK